MPDTVIAESQTAPPNIYRNRSPEIAKIAAALASAQSNFAPIPTDREVTVQTQTGGSYKFKYATLDAIRSATMPALSKQGLAIVQGMTDDERGLETMLVHSSGEWLRNVTPMIVSGRRGKDGKEYPAGNQELGSAQTYARRYGISALLCITADEDDDGNAADGNHISGPVGSAGGGGQFRPERRSSWGNGGKQGAIDEAKKDGLVTPPAAKPPAGRAVELMQWCKDSTKIIKDATVKGTLADWWRQNEENRDDAAAAIPTEYDKLIVLFDERMTAVSQAAA